MGKEKQYLDGLLEKGTFRFDALALSDVDNSPVLQAYSADISDQETCLFHREVATGDDYCVILHEFLKKGLQSRESTPVVRFADGEYAFYDYTLECNGLYRQAESIEAIRGVMPQHVEAMRTLAKTGKIASLIFPGNIRRKERGIVSFFHTPKRDGGARNFLELLHRSRIDLTLDNYIPFYVVYAYLTSKKFSELVDRKKICVIGSDCNLEACRQWFARFSSRPEILSVKIPDSYVATRWKSIQDEVLKTIPQDIDLCLVGAGIGSLLVCVDVAGAFHVPAIDAGHVLNLMNGQEDKSNGPRLYTIHRDGHGQDERST